MTFSDHLDWLPEGPQEGRTVVYGPQSAAGAVLLQSVPDDEPRLAFRGLKGFDSLDDLGILDRAIEQPEVEAPVAQTIDHRHRLSTSRPPSRRALGHGRFAAVRSSRALRAVARLWLVNTNEVLRRRE